MADVLTGGGGHDTFNFAVLPWNAGHVTDFTRARTAGPARIFKSSTITATNPVADGYLIFRDDGTRRPRCWWNRRTQHGQSVADHRHHPGPRLALSLHALDWLIG
jgi:hypothetical protein